MPSSQPHRKKVKHFDVVGHLHELTFSCFARKSLLTNDDWCALLARSIDAASKSEGFELIAFVFMPEHVHLLVLPRETSSKISLWLARVKQPFSKQIKGILEADQSPLLASLTVRERPGKFCFRFWQEGSGFDRNLYSLQAVEASVDYIHMNPVRRGLCTKAVDWKWSSARFFLEGIDDPSLPKALPVAFRFLYIRRCSDCFSRSMSTSSLSALLHWHSQWHTGEKFKLDNTRAYLK